MSYRDNRGGGGGKLLLLIIVAVVVAAAVDLLNQPTKTTFTTLELLFFR